jgi:hypothetical protein
MSTTTGEWSAYGSPVTLIAGSSINAITTGSWITSGATLLDNGTNKDQLGDIWLKLNSAITAGSGTPRLDVYLLPVPDGTNAPTPPGTSAALTPGSYYIGSIPANPSASFTSGVLRGVVLPPGEFLVTAQNNFGATTPAEAVDLARQTIAALRTEYGAEEVPS